MDAPTPEHLGHYIGPSLGPHVDENADMRDCFRRLAERCEREAKCGTEGFPHEFVDRVIGPFHPQWLEENRAFVEELVSGMSPKVCKICGRAGH